MNKIGLCLSGGGLRAAVFHLGVLERLAAQGLLERVHCLSTVSGGSLVTGLVLRLAGGEWPTSEHFRSSVQPAARTLLTTRDLQRAYLWRCLRSPWTLIRGRAAALARTLEDVWGIRMGLQDLPRSPEWLINATTYETGKNWRFERPQMGDWKTNYVLEPRLPVADAIAASAAVPGLIGPLCLRSADYCWHRKNWETREMEPVPPEFERISLWDGGVYENLGLEALFKPDRGYRKGVDFLLLSDASAPTQAAPSRFKAPYRLVEVAMDQVRGLRSRIIVNHFEENKGTGSLLRMGNTAEYVFDRAGADPPRHWDPEAALPEETVAWIREHGTHLHRLPPADYQRLFLHGYEIADVTLTAYCPGDFDHVPYASVSAP